MIILKHIGNIPANLKTGYAAWKSLQKNWVIGVSTKFTFLLILAGFAVLALRFNTLPSEVPLWYSKPWGADRLASPVYLFILPASMAVIYIADTVIALWVTSQLLVFTQALYLTTMLTSFMAFVSLLKIITLVT